MTDRLTDDEIKALHQFCTAQLPKRTPWVCLDASKMLRMLDEIEERRRAERAFKRPEPSAIAMGEMARLSAMVEEEMHRSRKDGGA